MKFWYNTNLVYNSLPTPPKKKEKKRVKHHMHMHICMIADTSYNYKELKKQTWLKQSEQSLRTGPSRRPAEATSERSKTQSPMATPGRAGAVGEGLNTPQGRFCMGKCESGSTSMNDLRAAILVACVSQQRRVMDGLQGS